MTHSCFFSWIPGSTTAEKKHGNRVTLSLSGWWFGTAFCSDTCQGLVALTKSEWLWPPFCFHWFHNVLGLAMSWFRFVPQLVHHGSGNKGVSGHGCLSAYIGDVAGYYCSRSAENSCDWGGWFPSEGVQAAVSFWRPFRLQQGRGGPFADWSDSGDCTWNEAGRGHVQMRWALCRSGMF